MTSPGIEGGVGTPALGCWGSASVDGTSTSDAEEVETAGGIRTCWHFKMHQDPMFPSTCYLQVLPWWDSLYRVPI